MQLTPAMRDFVLHWGEMGARWGVNRSVAQIHALLHLAERPMPAEEIADTLSIARSNVSTGLKELQAWRLVQVSRELGDRRDHFTSVRDMVELVRRVVEGRRAREYAPTVEAVRRTLAEAEADGTPADVVGRLRETLEVMELLDGCYRELARLPHGTQLALLKMGAKLARLMPTLASKEG